MKRLNDEIATARLDLGRREDKLEECEEYLEVSDGLTPKEWLTEFREVEDDGEIGLEEKDDGNEENEEKIKKTKTKTKRANRCRCILRTRNSFWMCSQN